MLSDTQIERYSRQIILPQVGGRGQAALLSATVTIGGDDQLATTAGRYLAAAGIGRLRVSPPLAAAIDGMTPDCQVTCLASDAAAAVRGAAVVLCAGAAVLPCVQLHAAGVAAGVPVIFAAATDAVGWMSACAGTDGPCYECLVRQLERVGSETAPLGTVVAGCMGTLLATEAIKLVLGLRPSYVGRLVTVDVLAGDVRVTDVIKDPRCTVCAGQG